MVSKKKNFASFRRVSVPSMDLFGKPFPAEALTRNFWAFSLTLLAILSSNTSRTTLGGAVRLTCKIFFTRLLNCPLKPPAPYSFSFFILLHSPLVLKQHTARLKHSGDS